MPVLDLDQNFFNPHSLLKDSEKKSILNHNIPSSDKIPIIVSQAVWREAGHKVNAKSKCGPS